MALSKKQVLAMFRESYTISNTDSIMNRENFHNFTDYLCKNGEITDQQYNNWSNPY